MSTTLQPQKTKFNRHLIIIFIIMFTEVLGFSMVLPIIPFLGVSLGLNALQVGLILSVFSFSQLFASPITGKLSDRFGRKPVLLISQTSTLIGFLLLGGGFLNEKLHPYVRAGMIAAGGFILVWALSSTNLFTSILHQYTTF